LFKTFTIGRTSSYHSTEELVLKTWICKNYKIRLLFVLLFFFTFFSYYLVPGENMEFHSSRKHSILSAFSLLDSPHGLTASSTCSISPLGMHFCSA